MDGMKWCKQDPFFMEVIWSHTILGGGFKYFLFLSLPGEDSLFWRAYFSEWLKPPTRIDSLSIRGCFLGKKLLQIDECLAFHGWVFCLDPQRNPVRACIKKSLASFSMDFVGLYFFRGFDSCLVVRATFLGVIPKKVAIHKSQYWVFKASKSPSSLNTRTCWAMLKEYSL